MSKLSVGYSEFKKGFICHYDAYNKLVDSGSVMSRNMTLFYSVECGLKCMMMSRLRIFNTREMNDSLIEHFSKHNLEYFIRELKLPGTFKFTPFNTKYNDPVTINTYHQFCRYCITPNGNSKNIEAVNNNSITLKSLAEHIKERV